MSSMLWKTLRCFNQTLQDTFQVERERLKRSVKVRLPSQNLTSKVPDDTKTVTLRCTSIFEPKTGHPSWPRIRSVFSGDRAHHDRGIGHLVNNISESCLWVSISSSSSRYDWYRTIIAQRARVWLRMRRGKGTPPSRS